MDNFKNVLNYLPNHFELNFVLFSIKEFYSNEWGTY